MLLFVGISCHHCCEPFISLWFNFNCSETSVSVSTSEQTSRKRLKLTQEELANLASASSTRYLPILYPCILKSLSWKNNALSVQCRLVCKGFILPTPQPFSWSQIMVPALSHFTTSNIHFHCVQSQRRHKTQTSSTHPFLLLTHFPPPCHTTLTPVHPPSYFQTHALFGVCKYLHQTLSL